MTKMILRRMCILAGMALMSVAANAFMFDVKIAIDRALNSPTLTVRYSGASVALVELKLNGMSLGTRSINSGKTNGETNFTLDLTTLVDGDNIVEVSLFDKNGKLVGTEKSNVAADDGAKSPVFLQGPKVGATVQGPVEIKVGFGRELKNTYVSFFIDNQFKAMMNVPPFNYIWDTERESNGWHELEAWVVDDSSKTMKTRKVKVFVNNVGGRTNRNVDVKPSTNPTNPTTVPITRLKPTKANSEPVAAKTSTPSGAMLLALNPATNNAGSMSGTKAISKSPSTATGPKHLTPTGTRLAVSQKNVGTVAATNAIKNTAGKVAITKGKKLPNLASLVLLYKNEFVNFDVSPRVENGIPLAPIRHLLEKAGGEVKWKAFEKMVQAKAEGREIFIWIGNKDAKVDGQKVEMEVAPFIDRGRTIVPLSFIQETLNVTIEFDPETGHVLITPAK
ncbi:MAG: hypothetical protein H7Y17_04435 [Chlorobia bacterium]|nr:hypothetical protein [Fimbriimonadaceae bacterium]